jgi:excisionase family DNA binding protein
MQPTTLTAKELAAYLGVSLATFYNMLNDGRFPVRPIRDLKPRRWNIEQVDAWRLGN